jgi:outer membrane protein assembly factor BamB
VAVFSPTSDKVTEAKLPSPILALHFLGEDLMIGEDRGALTRLAPDGTQRWQIVIPYVPMAWPYWSEYKSRVREITSADTDGDGKEEILISNSDRRVYAFSGDGVKIWQTPVEWGVYTAMTVGPYGSGVGLYGGTSKPSIHGWCIIYGLDGKIRKHYSRLDLQSWSIPSEFRDMRLADLDADGHVETINAIDTNCRQLVVYAPDGQVRWDVDVAGAAEAIAVRPGSTDDPEPVVYCSSAAGYVSAFDGSTGRRRWACFIGEAASFIETYGPDEILAIGPSGSVCLVDDQGRLSGHQSLNVPITAFLRPGDHRNVGSIVIGTEDGRLLMLPKPL